MKDRVEGNYCGCTVRGRERGSKTDAQSRDVGGVGAREGRRKNGLDEDKTKVI